MKLDYNRVVKAVLDPRILLVIFVIGGLQQLVGVLLIDKLLRLEDMQQ